MTIRENEKAIILQIEGGEFEIWMKLFYSTGSKKGELIEPSDEDFGVKAWSTYSLERAIQIFDEITEEKRDITPMTEIA